MSKWESFHRYMGVQGVAFILLVMGWVLAPYLNVVLDQTYRDVMLIVMGFYFSKNGNDIITAATNKLRKKDD